MPRNFAITSHRVYVKSTGNTNGGNDTDFTLGGSGTDDGFWNVGDPQVDGSTYLYAGHYVANGHLFLVFEESSPAGQPNIARAYSATANYNDAGYFSNYYVSLPPLITSPLATCFAAETLISTAAGEKPVESLGIGDLLCTADGRTIPVKWVGKQTLSSLFLPAERLMPVRFAAGSLGDGLPHSDLTVTADHAMLVDGVLCNAGALVNGHSIARVPLAEMGETFAVYHIETEAHEIILANGAPAETFIDNVSRRVFDNYAEFDALYGDVPEMQELPLPRALSPRQVPEAIRARLAGRQVA